MQRLTKFPVLAITLLLPWLAAILFHSFTPVTASQAVTFVCILLWYYGIISVIKKTIIIGLPIQVFLYFGPFVFLALAIVIRDHFPENFLLLIGAIVFELIWVSTLATYVWKLLEAKNQNYTFIATLLMVIFHPVGIYLLQDKIREWWYQAETDKI
jgi:hypothetical protein